jgi:hypothetical protein
MTTTTMTSRRRRHGLGRARASRRCRPLAPRFPPCEQSLAAAGAGAGAIVLVVRSPSPSASGPVDPVPLLPISTPRAVARGSGWGAAVVVPLSSRCSITRT